MRGLDGGIYVGLFGLRDFVNDLSIAWVVCFPVHVVLGSMPGAVVEQVSVLRQRFLDARQ